MKMLQFMILAEDAQGKIDAFKSKAEDLMKMGAGFVFGLLSLSFVAWGIYIGIKWMTAKKAEQYQEAKELLKRFFVGMALIFVIAAVAGIVFAAMNAQFASDLKFN